MSQFLETPNDLLNSENLYEFLAGYVCPEFHPFIEKPPFVLFTEKDGREIIGTILEKSNHKLRMYGSAQELADNLKIFRNHPESWRSTSPFAPFHAPVVIYYSLKNEPYIFKSDLLVIVQNIALKLFRGSHSDIDHFITMLGQAVKPFLPYELCNFDRLEFVKFNHQQVFEEIEKELLEGFTKTKELGNENVLRDLEKKDYRSITAMLNDIDPRVFDEEEKRLFIQNLLPSVKDNDFSRATQIFIARICSDYVEHSVTQRPGIFHSTPSLPNVRMFEDGDQRFVICYEIHDVVNKTSEGPLSGFLFDTCSMQKVEERYGDKTHMAEFIRTPILRAKHRAVLIPLGSVRFGILAADMLFEFLRNLIFGHKAFQKRTSDFLQQFKKFHFFDSVSENIYFLNTEAAQELNEAAKAALRNVENIPAKDVRNAKKDGFTVQNLKNELAHLGLLNAFPEIQNHAEVVYCEVDKRKKENVLRTCDLFDAIEHCQLICILSRLPKIRKFLHIQKGCHRVYGYKCEHCEEAKKEAQKTLELQKPSEPPKIKEEEQKMLELQSSSKIETLEKELAQMKLHLEKTLLENQKLQAENQKLFIKNDKKALASTKPSNTQFLDKKLSAPDTVLACTSNRIQCLICEIHVDSSNKDDVIRCPLCKRRFHKKCAFEWLKEHSQCPACNGDLPKS